MNWIGRHWFLQWHYNDMPAPAICFSRAFRILDAFYVAKNIKKIMFSKSLDIAMSALFDHFGRPSRLTLARFGPQKRLTNPITLVPKQIMFLGCFFY